MTTTTTPTTITVTALDDGTDEFPATGFKVEGPTGVVRFVGRSKSSFDAFQIVCFDLAVRAVSV